MLVNNGNADRWELMGDSLPQQDDVFDEENGDLVVDAVALGTIDATDGFRRSRQVSE